MHRLLYFILALLSLSVVASCIDRPECVLDEPQMVDVLVDVHRAEGLLELQDQQGHRPDQNDLFQKEVIAAVLQKHGVTRAQYDSSLMWYAQHLKLLTRVYGHVDERLKEEHDYWTLQASESQDFQASEAGDSVNLWTLRRHLVLDMERLSDARFWEFQSDSNFEVGDTLRWRFMVRQLLPSQKLVASISLTERPLDPNEAHRVGDKKRELRGEPIGYCHQVIKADGSYELLTRADSLQSFGSAILSLVLLQDSVKASPVFIDSITLLRTHLRSE